LYLENSLRVILLYFNFEILSNNSLVRKLNVEEIRLLKRVRRLLILIITLLYNIVSFNVGLILRKFIVLVSLLT
jgi:hypothetical protein